MRIWNKRGCFILAFLLSLVLGGVLFIFLTGKSTVRQLRADHDRGLELIREYWSKKPTRPVLRGEALSGNGGRKLAGVLAEIESEYAKPPWSLLFSDARGTLPEESKARLEEVYAHGKRFLPDVRDALLHEYCRLPFDYVESGIGGDYLHSIHIRDRAFFLGGLLLRNARHLADQGEYAAALRDVTDAIRLSHDLGRGTGMNAFHHHLNPGKGAAVELLARLLHEYSVPSEAIEACLVEVSLLRTTRPNDSFGSVVEEYDPMISMFRQYQRQLTGETGHDLAAMMGLSIGVLRIGGLRLELHHESFEEYRRIVRLEYSKAEAEIPDFMELDNRLRWLGAPHPLRTKEADLNDEMKLACLEAGLLAYLCRSSHEGTWPKTLAGCRELPLDPWGAAFLRYKPPAEAKPAIIYSISMNRRDDQGEAETPFMGKSPDYVFPLGPWPETKQQESR